MLRPPKGGKHGTAAMPALRKKPWKRIALFGHFNRTNLGNEATLTAAIECLRRLYPDAEYVCISTGPHPDCEVEGLRFVHISEPLFPALATQIPWAKFVRRIILGAPSELYRWFDGIRTLKGVDALIFPGTGLLTDAFGLCDCGPYSIFKWSLIAKLSRCKLVFLSVGAGPIRTILGKWLLRASLSLADFRSYRDRSSRQCLQDIGLRAENDLLYPDLAFGLPAALTSDRSVAAGTRPVVGVGLMNRAGTYGAVSSANANARHQAYLESLAEVLKWLLAQGYDIRLFNGDILDDAKVMQEFSKLLRKSIPPDQLKRVVDEPVRSVERLLAEINRTDFVIATRFHNVLLSLLCDRPTISISFHHKCDALMDSFKLADYCVKMNDVSTDILMGKVRDLMADADRLKAVISAKGNEFRDKLSEQYVLLAGMSVMQSLGF